MFPLRNNSFVNCFIMVSKRERSSRRVISRCSGNPLPFIICSLFAIFSCSFLHCSARDSITMNSSLSDENEETLVSAGGRFELGFFTPNISKNRRYVGIWYHKSNPRLVVWVANRGNPLVDNNGVLAIEGANLKLLDAKGTSYFSTNAKRYSSPNWVAKLMDSGNLVLSDDQSAKSIWESFQQPTDTFLTGMKMDENLILTSWVSADDPKIGDFAFSTVQNWYVVKNRSYTYWKSGECGKFFGGDVMPSPITYLLSNFSPSAKPNKANSSYDKLNLSSIGYGNTRLTMSFTGKIQYWSKDKEESWSLIWEEPRDNCSLYNFCGSFGSCNSNNNLKCKCLPGFVPKSPATWESGDFSGGCQRKNGTCGGNDEFLPLKMMKVQNPDVLISGKSKTECLTDCRNNCKCQAYAHDEANNGTRRTDPTTPAMCWIWTDDLSGLQEKYFNGGRDLYFRVSATDIENGYSMQDLRKHSKKQWIPIVGVTVASLIVLSCTVIYFYLRRRKVKRQENRENVGLNMAVRFYDSARHVKDLVDTEQFKEEDKKAIDLPFFEFESILAATDNFSEANKLGKGGFGPVYKGKFPGGQEVAVKRLSKVSGQGLEEFKNEVVLIARLQHRNLVRLLGYCIEGAEQILLYEYMPNKSLDSFIFDPKLKELLDWETRFNIIMGIARGLLYLHQDSRLRIIHRDLKTSNVLLDHEMNPKISDFGLAKIFEGKQTEGTTARVVGTYGYMSPEYALDGFFSVKSDVFSFGVVVLEIVSGKRNTGSYDSKEGLSLLGYTWRLWQEDKALDIMDQKLGASSKRNEVLKCINIGLLCAQEDPDDRPNMSNVIFMLGSEPATLPIPKRPAFVLRRGPSFTTSSSSKPDTNAELTVSLAGR